MSTRTRSTAPERRAQVIAAAVPRFADRGYHGTSTEDIAADTGLSQPYLFRLFGTKLDLFLACCDACSARIAAAFRDAVAGDTPEDRLHSMGSAYNDFLLDEQWLRFQLQMYAAAGEPGVRDHVAAGWAGLVADIRALSGAGDEEVFRFLGVGMLLNVAASLDVAEILEFFKE